MTLLAAEPSPRPSADPLLDQVAEAVDGVQCLQERAIARLAARLAPGGRLDPERFEREQRAAHGLAWLATYAEALRQLLGWAARLEAAGSLGRRERLILQLGCLEYLARIAGGIAMSQGEIVRPDDLGLSPAEIRRHLGPAQAAMGRAGGQAGLHAELALLLAGGDAGDAGEGDETLDLIAAQFRRFADERVLPHAQRWHLEDALIPDGLLRELGELGVFGLTIEERHGGLGLGKAAMCVVTEELSRAWLGVGSLGTRAEIAAELISRAGTDAQQARYLPRIAAGEILPTAVFTEPDTGSDLASLTTRAVRAGEVFRVHGAKTWITHAARADLMTILCRTGPEPGYRGLSILLAEKPRGTEAEPFPVPGLSGGEIPVLGYRGMREYTLAFDGFEVPVSGLLGGVEGEGFKQLMATFEAARIQTAARAIGVARSAFDLARAYAHERRQFGKPLYAYPRIYGKLTWMAVETMLARQLTRFAARQKDAGRRCDLEAGMAKLLAAQVAWSAADAALQIHGGNGYALEYPISRVLCDARILSVFEGTAEIQAQVIARRLLGAA